MNCSAAEEVGGKIEKPAEKLVPKNKGRGFMMVKNIVNSCWVGRAENKATYLIPHNKPDSTKVDLPVGNIDPPPTVPGLIQEEPKPTIPLFKERNLWCD